MDKKTLMAYIAFIEYLESIEKQKISLEDVLSYENKLIHHREALTTFILRVRRHSGVWAISPTITDAFGGNYLGPEYYCQHLVYNESSVKKRLSYGGNPEALSRNDIAEEILKCFLKYCTPSDLEDIQNMHPYLINYRPSRPLNLNGVKQYIIQAYKAISNSSQSQALCFENGAGNIDEYYQKIRSDYSSIGKKIFGIFKRPCRARMIHDIDEAITKLENENNEENKQKLVELLESTIGEISDETRIWKSGLKTSCKKLLNDLDADGSIYEKNVLYKL